MSEKKERKYEQQCGPLAYWIELNWEADYLGAGETSWIEFVVKDIESWDESGRHKLGDDVIRGVLKWDGCSHISGPGDDSCMGHFCDGFFKIS